MITLIPAILFLPCYAVILLFAFRTIVLFVRGASRAIRNMLFGRASDIQSDSIEGDRAHGESETLIPIVFCGTWMRLPEGAASVGQSEWSSVQPVSVSVFRIACKSALGACTVEHAVTAYASTWFPNDSKFSAPIQNLPKIAMIVVMIQMLSPILRHLKERNVLSYNAARPDDAPSELQIGVAQVDLSTRIQPPGERTVGNFEV
ncbi:hypothetical protein EDD22DRAFT_971916 [Suillus occidentalis]|nr:hypothetical protein EDD22DRAFT_971916 [Suillus occidentalis]